MSRLLAGFALLGGLCSAQSPSDLFSKAPPAIDDALRARVSRFYQAAVDGKFRVAEQLVAEEAKDIYFEAEKRRCRKFEIVRINYKEDFASASVVTNCDTEVMIPPAGMMRVTLPMSSNWKVENGDWFWYVPPRPTKESPFGTFTPGEGDGVLSTPALPRGPGAKDLQAMVTADRDSVQVNADKPSNAAVTITNAMPGSVRLRVERIGSADLVAELDKTDLNSKDQATLTIRYTPMPQQHPRGRYSTEVVNIIAEPTNAVVAVRVRFAIE